MFSFKGVSFINCGMVRSLIIEKVYIIFTCSIPIALNIFSLLYAGGNVVVYDKDTVNSTSLWASNTAKNPGSTLRLNDNGVVSIENSQGFVIWRAEPMIPIRVLTSSPTISPSPTLHPTLSLAPSISLAPTHQVTYFPGNLTLDKDTGLFISQGLNIRLIAQSDKRVLYYSNDNDEEQKGQSSSSSDLFFQKQPDAATCIPKRNGEGWHYLINSEVNGGDIAKGGVGQITFGPLGEVEQYDMVLTGTKMNCGGGRTPWNTFSKLSIFY